MTRVALPNVNIDSSTSTEVGQDWLEYLNKGETYQEPLNSGNFKTIKEKS
ncbi:MAG: hypothetical protein ACI837_002196 [Crocinitomicaceae bacterium]